MSYSWQFAVLISAFSSSKRISISSLRRLLSEPVLYFSASRARIILMDLCKVESFRSSRRLDEYVPEQIQCHRDSRP
jgi:hypothetical protein